jgi:hypothetical protein
MGYMVSAPACIEMYCLLQEFQHAVSELNRMQSAQVAAVLKGEDLPYKAEIVRAAKWRDQVKHEVLAHKQEHG